jgi:Zn-dependent peptidase ImmA (M78 family)
MIAPAPAPFSPFAHLLILSRQAPPPVDLERVADGLGLKIIYDELSSGIAGGTFKDNSAAVGYRIIANARDKKRRQRFTLAHEIAHYVLHRDMLGDGMWDSGRYESPLGPRYEEQANRLAADILMPSDLVRTYYEQEKSVSGLAELFGVSTDAMNYRLQELGVALASGGRGVEHQAN